MTNYELLYQKVVELGMQPRIGKGYVWKFKYDEEAFPVNDISKKEWAITKGFYPGNIDFYNLTEDNFRNYLPYYQYFMIHPLNNHFKIWLGDKLTCKYVLNSNGCEDVMPDYYVYVENDGSYTYLMNCPKVTLSNVLPLSSNLNILSPKSDNNLLNVLDLSVRVSSISRY